MELQTNCRTRLQYLSMLISWTRLLRRESFIKTLSQRKVRKKHKGKVAPEQLETDRKEETEIKKGKENHWSRATAITMLILKGVGLKNAMFNKKKRKDKIDEVTRKELQERKERLEKGRQETITKEQNTNTEEEEDPWNPRANMPQDIASQVVEKKNKYKGRKWKTEGRDVKEEEWRRGND